MEKKHRHGGYRDSYRCLSLFRGEGTVSCIYPEQALQATFPCKGPTRREFQFLPWTHHHRNITKHHSLLQRPVTKTCLLHSTPPTYKTTSCLPIWMKISTVGSLVIARTQRRKRRRKYLLTFSPNSGPEPSGHRGADCRRQNHQRGYILISARYRNLQKLILTTRQSTRSGKRTPRSSTTSYSGLSLPSTIGPSQQPLTCYSSALEWPTLTTQWFPDKQT